MVFIGRNLTMSATRRLISEKPRLEEGGFGSRAAETSVTHGLPNSGGFLVSLAGVLIIYALFKKCAVLG